tara:strand:- start:542 stop:946 length:405 start_codon:yes stop_codon:yes gene_type:complete
MALKKTKLVSIVNVTGIATVGIYTAGLTATAAGVGSTSFIRSVILHNTGLSTARAGLYIHPNTEASQRVGSGKSDAFRILRVDLAANETTFFESNYPIVLAPYNAIAVDVIAPDSGGSGIGSMINVQVNGDTES